MTATLKEPTLPLDRLAQSSPEASLGFAEKLGAGACAGCPFVKICKVNDPEKCNNAGDYADVSVAEPEDMREKILKDDTNIIRLKQREEAIKAAQEAEARKRAEQEAKLEQERERILKEQASQRKIANDLAKRAITPHKNILTILAEGLAYALTSRNPPNSAA